MKTIYEFLLKNKTITSTQDTDYVDLGLPSGLLWAKCNIGAKKPIDHGDYFMWGSTKPNTNDKCNWAHAPFNNGSSEFDSNYFKSVKNKVCPNNVLLPEYDAAAVILGNGWRMPTKEDFEELIENSRLKVVNRYNEQDTYGMVFTSKENKAEMFIPCGGFINSKGAWHNKTCGLLWASTFCARLDDQYARNIFFEKLGCELDETKRHWGLNIRPVKET